MTIARFFASPSSPARATSGASCHMKPGTALAGAFARSWNSVWVNPGHSTVTDTPVPLNSSCSASVNDVTNAFVAP